MTLEEYKEKRESYMSSTADYETKRKAIEDLDRQYLGSTEAIKQIEECMPTYEDLKDVL